MIIHTSIKQAYNLDHPFKATNFEWILPSLVFIYISKKLKFFWIGILTTFVLSRGEPMQLLKSINPAEAGLLDAASRCHIRFRLGGERFPPLIYYKIFAHGGIVDINAFAPRDYH